jgi:hypothetical protein
LGVISKVLGRETYASTFEPSGISRGLYQFYYSPSSPYSYIISALCTPEYTQEKIVAYDTAFSTWLKLKEISGGVSLENTVSNSTALPYHTNFAQATDTFRDKNTLYFCNGEFFKKWFVDNVADTSAEVISDVKNVSSLSSLTGTIYFGVNGTAVCTGAGTSFLTQANKGAWIRENSSASWWEVKSCTSETVLTLRYWTGSSTSSSTAQSAVVASVLPRFVLYWNNRLWGYNDTVGSKYSYLRCSAVLASSTPAALETWTGADTGFVDVPGNGIYGTGLIATQDYLFCFKDTNYSVYQYDSSIVPPIALVKTWNYGCPAFRTLALVDNGVIYWTGTELRFTTGFQDVSLSGSVANGLRYQHPSGSMVSYYRRAISDNNMPQGIYDEVNKIYHLYFPNVSTGTTIDYAYDWDKKIWIGNDKYNNVGTIAKVYSTLSSTTNNLVYHPVSGGNQLYNISASTPTTTTGEIQSSDLAFGDAKHQKKISWIEFWIHPPYGSASATSETTLAFNYYMDGRLALSTPLTTTITEDDGDTNYYKKVRFNISPTCTFFRWSLKDQNQTNGNGQLSIIGGFIGYDVLDVN